LSCTGLTELFKISDILFKKIPPSIRQQPFFHCKISPYIIKFENCSCSLYHTCLKANVLKKGKKTVTNSRFYCLLYRQDTFCDFTIIMRRFFKLRTRINLSVKSLPWLILTDKQHIVRSQDFNLDELDEKVKEAENEK